MLAVAGSDPAVTAGKAGVTASLGAASAITVVASGAVVLTDASILYALRALSVSVIDARHPCGVHERTLSNTNLC